MRRATIASLLVMYVLTGATGQEKAKVPQGESPGFYTVMMLGEKTVKLKGLGDTTYKADLGDLVIQDATGKRLTPDDFRKRVQVGSVVIVSSDEKRIDPAYLKVLNPETVVIHGATVLLARPENPGRGWTLDLKEMAFGEGPLAGRMLGSEFKADKVLLQNTGLHLQSGTDHIHIFLRLKPGQGIEGKNFEWGKDEKEERRPSIHIHVNSEKSPRIQVVQKGYAMRLEFGTEKDGKLPGKIYLCLPDERKSWIAGSFTFDWQ